MSLALVTGGSACKDDKQKAATANGEDEPGAGDASRAEPEVTVAEAEAFVKRLDADLRRLWTKASKAEWAKSTNITKETEQAAAEANAEVMAYETNAIKQADKFEDIASKLGPEVRRQLELLELTSTLPAPDEPKKREELARIAARLEGMYGKGKVCEGEGKNRNCRDLGELSEVMATSRDYDKLLEAWTGWRTISVPMRPLYERLVELGNEGARDIGYSDMGELWRSRYDMTPVAFDQEMTRLWNQVRPLYEQLHCYVRAKLRERYGEKIPEDGPIPAHLLGNMWAQDWANLYPLLEPHPGEPSIDVTKALERNRYTPKKMVKLGEKFFTSLGLDPLPGSFWARSMFVKPDDREVVCHASAWDVDMNNDLRIKMCIKVNHEDLVTVHHELGHNYYYNSYYELPVLFQSGAHDGFHEAIGDAIALSITPSYLAEVGLLDEVSQNERGVINEQMQDALQKIAFLPFGRMVDEWRWEVFAGRIEPSAYNDGWWKLREKYQGVAASVERTEQQFDPGAKYHVPANVPYARYFLAHILQFQFHKALCEASGHQGPLHRCSIYGSKKAGEKLRAMLALGASKPWPDALEALTETREMDATALLEYFAPLSTYLEKQNTGRSCGW